MYVKHTTTRTNFKEDSLILETERSCENLSYRFTEDYIF